MNRQELKFDAKEKMRQAAVNPYVVTIIMGVIIVIMSVVQVVLNVWGELISSELPSAEENSVHTSFPLLYFLLFTY